MAVNVDHLVEIIDRQGEKIGRLEEENGALRKRLREIIQICEDRNRAEREGVER